MSLQTVPPSSASGTSEGDRQPSIQSQTPDVQDTLALFKSSPKPPHRINRGTTSPNYILSSSATAESKRSLQSLHLKTDSLTGSLKVSANFLEVYDQVKHQDGAKNEAETSDEEEEQDDDEEDFEEDEELEDLSSSGDAAWDDVWDDSWTDPKNRNKEEHQRTLNDEEVEETENGQLLRILNKDFEDKVGIYHRARFLWPLPIEINIVINGFLEDRKDMISFMLVCRQTLNTVAPTIWKCPDLSNGTVLKLFVRTIRESRVYQVRRFAAMVEELDLATLPVSDDDLFDVIARCENMVKFTIRNKQISSTPLVQLFTSCRHLKHLNLAGCEGVEIHFFVSRLVGLPSPTSATLPQSPVRASPPCDISFLNLSRTRLDDDDVANLMLNLRTLATFRSTGCKNITDKALKYIAEHGISLVQLSVSECQVTDTQSFGAFGNEQDLCFSESNLVSVTVLSAFEAFGRHRMPLA
ncbi:hypothetical protein HDU76_008909 [Blyttiomyces sp. JEL0837]|nr:hypothetical protein HDU76_008909 [Blyttiomyces sp. JEL0837]